MVVKVTSYWSGQISSRVPHTTDGTPQMVREIPLFQGNLGLATRPHGNKALVGDDGD